MKLVKIMSLAFGLILLVSAAGFAQTSMLTTFSTITVAPNAQTALVGEIDFVPQTTGTIPPGESITVTYGTPISSTSQIQVFVSGCTPLPITLTNLTGTGSCTGGGSIVVTVNPTAGTILLSFETAAVSTPINVQFVRITGVRVNVAAAAVAIGGFINVSVTASTGVGTITNNVVPVAQVAEPISLTAAIFPLIQQTGGDSVSSVKVTELFPNAFETQGATYPTQIVLNVTPPTGFTFVTTGYTSGQSLTTTNGAVATIASVSGTTITVNIISQGASTNDSITVPVTFHADGPVPLNPGSATITATLAPPLKSTETLPVAVGPTLGSDRYAVRTVSVSISFNVGQLQTILYATFNVWSSDFNTGFAIGNPTGVVQIPAAGHTAATLFFRSAQPGTVQVWLIAMDGTVKTVTTSATVKPGLGLDANGMVPAGGEWAVLLSELATAAGFTSFEGQVIFVTNFSDAHGVNFIADPDFATQSQGYQMLVVPNANPDIDGGVGYNN